MKSTRSFLMIVSVLLLCATACTVSFTKKEYIKNYEDWIVLLKKNCVNYKEADWTTAEFQFNKYSEIEFNQLKNDLTPQEIQKVDSLTGQYYAIIAKYKASQVKEKLKRIMNTAKSMFEELQKK